MNTNEVLKLALEALEPLVKRASPYGEVDWLTGCKAITALREALAEQPTQQGHSCYCPNCEALSKELAELQAQKPIAWRVKWPAIGGGYKWMMVDSPLMEKEGFVNEALYGKAQALAEQPAQQQEPVAWIEHEWSGSGLKHLHFDRREPSVRDEVMNPVWTPLYTSPQPAQQEPVATITITQRGSTRTIDNHFDDCVRGWPDGEYNLYTSPPAQQEPVTWGVDWGKAGDIPCVSIIKRLPGGGIEVVAVEYAPYEYNPPAQQEPDAFVPREAIRTLSGGANHVPATLTLNDDGGKAVAVFLSPQPAQRTWVWLTDEEMLAVVHYSQLDNARAIEAKLKEKNT